MTEPDLFHPTSFTTITVEIDEAAKVAVVTPIDPRPTTPSVPPCRRLKSVAGVRSDDRVNAIVLAAAGGSNSVSASIDGPSSPAWQVTRVCTARRTTSCTTIRVRPQAEIVRPLKPVICAVNGMACGGAFYMLAESDIISLPTTPPSLSACHLWHGGCLRADEDAAVHAAR